MQKDHKEKVAKLMARGVGLMCAHYAVEVDPKWDAATRVDQAYIHMDLDVLDPTELRANVYAVPGGLTVAQMADVVRFTGRHLKIAAAGITAYDPDQDPEGRGVRAAERLLEALAG